jgi:hypothetical protein
MVRRTIIERRNKPHPPCAVRRHAKLVHGVGNAVPQGNCRWNSIRLLLAAFLTTGTSVVATGARYLQCNPKDDMTLCPCRRNKKHNPRHKES